jgi:peptidyl-tRNA hydrolase
LRLGILNNEKSVRQEVSDYVLGRFTRDEMGVVDQVNQKITKLFPELLDGKLESFSNKFYL